MTYLTNNSFNGLKNLNKLILSRNKISEIYKDNFKGLNNLLDLQISNNKISHIKNETFLYLNQLESVSLDSNEIDTIDLNAFSNLNKLKYLNLNQNRIKQIINLILDPKKLKKLSAKCDKRNKRKLSGNVTQSMSNWLIKLLN